MNDPSSWVYESDTHSPTRHAKERAENGFSIYDWWNFNSYLCYVIIAGLEKFKTGSGHPVYGGVETMDDWISVLDKMIAGFQARWELDDDFPNLEATAEERKEWRDSREKLWEEGSGLFIKFFPSLWD